MKKIYFILFISVFLFSLNGEASDTDSFSLWVGNMNIIVYTVILDTENNS